MSGQVVIQWTPEMLERFRKEYQKHKDQPEPFDVFEFDGHEFMVAYARYLIQYLDWQFHGIEP